MIFIYLFYNQANFIEPQARSQQLQRMSMLFDYLQIAASILLWLCCFTLLLWSRALGV